MLLCIGDHPVENGPAEHVFGRIGRVQSQRIVLGRPLLGSVASPKTIVSGQGGRSQEGARMRHCQFVKRAFQRSMGGDGGVIVLFNILQHGRDVAQALKNLGVGRFQTESTDTVSVQTR